MSNNGATDNRHYGHNQTAIIKPDDPLVCDAVACGKHCDQWGPWECSLCHGLGYVTRQLLGRVGCEAFRRKFKHTFAANLNRPCIKLSFAWANCI